MPFSASAPLSFLGQDPGRPGWQIKALSAVVTSVCAHAPKAHEHVGESPVPRPAHVRRIAAWTHERTPTGSVLDRNTYITLYLRRVVEIPVYRGTLLRVPPARNSPRVRCWSS